ncbi:MAG: 16S rRNA processing protein RimM [Chloroflexi bacterium]|nr:16S rRNA processing protein RimM [Chloroflexota bacterium]
MKDEIIFQGIHPSSFIPHPSSLMDKPAHLIIGRVRKPFGVRGELKIEILTDFPERFASLRQVFLGDDAKSFAVESARLHSGAALLKLAGIDTPEDAATLREQLVYVAREDAVALPADHLYLYQLIGLRVKTRDGAALGEITEVLDTRANDVYIVSDGTREILLPAIPDVVKEIDLARGEMLVELIDGLVG